MGPRMKPNERARDLRRGGTWPERILWGRLRNRRLGAKFRRQHPIGPYYCDFYCHEARLVVELDGGSHATPAGRSHDDCRDAWLTEQGCLVLRVSNVDVVYRLDLVLACIVKTLTPALSRQRERKLESHLPAVDRENARLEIDES